jgi:hypothetical protein
MLHPNLQIDKLAACHNDFKVCKMLSRVHFKPEVLEAAVNMSDMENDEYGPIDNAYIMNEVRLAHTKGMFILFIQGYQLILPYLKSKTLPTNA